MMMIKVKRRLSKSVFELQIMFLHLILDLFVELDILVCQFQCLNIETVLKPLSLRSQTFAFLSNVLQDFDNLSPHMSASFSKKVYTFFAEDSAAGLFKDFKSRFVDFIDLFLRPFSILFLFCFHVRLPPQ